MFTRLYKLNTPFHIWTGLKTIILFVQVGLELAIQSFRNQMLNKFLKLPKCFMLSIATWNNVTLHRSNTAKDSFQQQLLRAAKKKKKEKKGGRITESCTAELCRRLLQINISNLYMNILSMTTTHKHTAKVLKSTQERLLSHQPAPDRIHWIWQQWEVRRQLESFQDC